MSEQARKSVAERLAGEAAKPANNGLRLPVSFGRYTGPAGVVLRGGRTEVAFPAKKSDAAAGAAGTIDGEPYRVEKVERSGEARGGRGPDGMVRLTVTAVTQ